MAGRPKGSGGRAEELSADQIKLVSKCLNDTRCELRNRALFYFGLGTGMRIGEIIGLTVGDVAPHGPVLNRIVLEKHSTKSKKTRTVAISKQAIAHLDTYLKDRRSKKELKPEAPLFPSGRYPLKPISERRALSMLKHVFVEAGVANASSHSMRRTHANNLRRQGTDMMIIREQLGHSSLAITQRYFQTDPVEVQSAVDTLKF